MGAFNLSSAATVYSPFRLLPSSASTVAFDGRKLPCLVLTNMSLSCSTYVSRSPLAHKNGPSMRRLRAHKSPQLPTDTGRPPRRPCRDTDIPWTSQSAEGNQSTCVFTLPRRFPSRASVPATSCVCRRASQHIMPPLSYISNTCILLFQQSQV